MALHRIGLTALAAGLLLTTAAQAQTELTVYSAIEAEDLKRYAETFNQDHPDIKINWVRDSTGVVTAKLLAEKNNPQADVVWGLAATSLLLLKTEGMLEPYRSEEHTSELQSLMRISYAVFCLKKKKQTTHDTQHTTECTN